MKQAVYIIDAFTSEPFKGNPAAVCLMEQFPEDDLMQSIAQEINLSETAFLVKKSPFIYELRWFTPTVEVNLCGHGTLAATHMLLQEGHIKADDTVTYHTQSGPLTARSKGDAIELDFPVLQGEKTAIHPALDSLGVRLFACEHNRDNYLVEVKDYKTLLACTPDFHALAKMDLQGVIVTTATDVPGYDFASRYFGPNCGIDEDPVTGSAHCFLAPYWAKKLGKQSFRALQASKRTGVLEVSLHGERVLIAGHNITVLKGELILPTVMTKEIAA